jgi:hypothetical protein
MLADTAEVPLVPVQGHGPTSLFKLLMGTAESRRDLSAGGGAERERRHSDVR